MLELIYTWVEMGPLTNQSKFSFDKLIHLPRNSNQNSDNRQYIEPFFHSIALLIVITVTLGHKHISFSCTLIITSLHLLQPFKLRPAFIQYKIYNIQYWIAELEQVMIKFLYFTNTSCLDIFILKHVLPPVVQATALILLTFCRGGNVTLLLWIRRKSIKKMEY